MADIRVSYDSQAKAAYVYLTEEPIARTVELVVNRIWADLDVNGRAVGLEVIDVDAENIPSLLKALEEAMNDDGDGLDQKGRDLLAIA